MLVNELTDGVDIDQVLLVRAIERRSRRDGGEYLRLQLGDRTGAVVSMVWEELAEMERLATQGAPVHVTGRYTVHPRFGPQINLRTLTAAEPGSFALSDLLDGPATLPRADGGGPARAARDRAQPPPQHPARAGVRRGLAAMGALPRGAGRQVLPPGLPSRAA